MIEHAACTSADPYIFGVPDEPAAALTYCGECPVRAWCLRQVQPAISHFDGVAGGHAWARGEHVSGDRDDPILHDYLQSIGKRLPRKVRRRRSPRERRESVDAVVVRQFLDGHVDHTRLNSVERRFAAAYLIGSGWERSAALRHCHVRAPADPVLLSLARL